MGYPTTSVATSTLFWHEEEEEEETSLSTSLFLGHVDKLPYKAEYRATDLPCGREIWKKIDTYHRFVEAVSTFLSIVTQ